MRSIRVFAVAALFLALLSTPAVAQVAPDARWRTIESRHFRVHFADGLDALARRTAVNAERAWEGLARSLHPPRGPIDIVLSDDVDFSNGSATPFPTNRIVIYAAPPLEPGALRFTDDWNELVVTHELTHIFHLDRTRGLWWLGQRIFGRAPFLFPNTYGPAWLTEGLAVWFESELTGAGRLRGTEHRALARAAALEHRVPRLDELSLATPRFPGGNAAYAFGSLFVEYLAREGGAPALRDLIDRQASQLIPYWIDRPARGAFGDPLRRSWEGWRDSLVATVGESRDPLPEWRALRGGDLSSGPPRWADDSTLLSAGGPGKYPATARRVTVGGETVRGTRRWTISPQVPLADGGVLFSQIDFRDPYRLRSDLWIEREGGRRRITSGARLAHPDARRDGAIVAVQALAGGSRLVRVSADGEAIMPITTGGPDTNWSEPRWSPNGTRIAAIRWTSGGMQQLVVLDTAGVITHTLESRRAVVASPSWINDGALLYTSDHTGRSNIYGATLAGASTLPLSDAATGLFYPSLSPEGEFLAAVRLTARGYELGIAPFPNVGAIASSATMAETVSAGDRQRSTAGSSPEVRRYSPVRTMLPRWWLPVAESGLDDGARFGALTSGADVVGRHSYLASIAFPTDNSGTIGNLSYRYAGFGLPLLDLFVEQDWERAGAVLNQQREPIGEVRRRIRDAQLGVTFVRPRMRQSSSFTLAAGVEERHFTTSPESLFARLSSPPRDVVRPRLVAAAGWSRLDYAPWGISAEQGVTLSGSAFRRWSRGIAESASHTGIASATGYLPLDLPGFARHVLSARVAGGATDRRTTSALEVGGTSGSVLAVLPGYLLGEGRETFGVRGFSGAALTGIRATAGTIEYRAPLALNARGLRLLPLFLERTGITFFGEGGSAYCPQDQARRFLCRWTGGDALPADTNVVVGDAWQRIASVGAELHVNLAVMTWDQPYRFRIGVAAPVHGREYARADRVSGYLAVGLAY